MYLLICVVFVILIAWSFERFYLRGSKLPEFPVPSDPDAVQKFTNPQGPGPQQLAVNEFVLDITARISTDIRQHQLKTARSAMDTVSDNRQYLSRFLPADAGGVPAEWALAPGADPGRRILYLHGGGFIMGSPKSHRTITSKFSEITGCAVLAIDYRLLPEYKQMDCFKDCQTAYHWLINNGPDGPEDIRQMFFAGDSAGGNLALSLAAWVRDNKLRAPDAVVALSPLTDLTFSGASIHSNEATDIMLAPIIRLLKRLPDFAKSWVIFWTHKVRPANPVASPLFGDLSGLPPTLVQASASEMLLDDARRYVYKACASGSPVKLQTWADTVHVWQIFDPELPQAVEAWKEIGRFLEACA